ncbi:dystroglycan-like [Dorcoceras hygrometricum]|uniref:Dystroglycan-like n=1 Tax=Dorcoceras hygrometricum TaxID=472368 RepID=A0A2Z7AED8_9LAMI|nr:dystroglycan-like [Dorcoceras hygrometricum]
MASGLQGFLGCPAVIYESELVDFFNNGSMRDGLVVSTVNGVPVEFSEHLFAETFEILVDGLEDLSDMPKDKILDDRSIVSLAGEPVSLSGRKWQMKIEYRLLCDIMAKSISVKAGSFNALTVEKFSLLTAVVCGIRINWASILFNILKKMVSAGSKQAKGFAVQISLMLESIPNLELGESMEFPASKILTPKTVHRYISINDKVGGEEIADAPPVKKTPKKPTVSKKRPAAAEEQVLKKKTTLKKKSVTYRSTLEMVAVAQEVVPIQMVEESAGVPTAEKPAAEDNIPANQPVNEDTGETGDQESAEDVGKRDDEPVFLPAVAHIVDVETSAADDVDHIIQQVLSKAAQSASTEGEQIEELDIHDLIAKWDAEKEVTTPNETDEEIEAGRASEPVDRVQTEVSQPAYLVEKSADMEKSTADQSVDEFIDAEEARSLEDIILSIPADVPLPSAAVEITKIIFGKEIKIPGVDEKACYLATLPQIPVDEKGKENLVEKDHVKGNPAQEHFSLTCADIDLLVNLRAQVIDDVDQFFNSFSFKKLATMNLEGISAKGEQVLGRNREYPRSPFQEDIYFVDVPCSFDDLKQQAVAHGIIWDRPCCSILFDDRLSDQRTTSAYDIFEVSSQRQYDETLPLMSEFFRLMKKRWAGVCLEAVDFCASRRLLPVGSVDFCREIGIDLRFCLDVHRSSILLTELYDQDIQLTLDPHQSSPTSSEDTSMSFDDTDIAVTTLTFSQPGSSNFSPDITEAIHQLRTSLDQIRNRDAGAALKDIILMHLHDIEKKLTARFDTQERWLGALRNDSNDQRNLLSLEIQSSQRKLNTQITTVAIDQIDMRREVKELNAKVDAMATNLEIFRRDAEATKEAISHQLLEFQAQAQANHNILHAQLSELVNYINRGGDAKKGEGSSSRPQPPPSAVQNLESGQSISLEEAAERILVVSYSFGLPVVTDVLCTAYAFARHDTLHAISVSCLPGHSAGFGVGPAGGASEIPPRRRGRSSRQAVVDSRTPVSADREEASKPSVPLGFSESQSSAFLALANAVNRAVDLMESLTVGQTRVYQSTGQSVDPVPSETSVHRDFHSPITAVSCLRFGQAPGHEFLLAFLRSRAYRFAGSCVFETPSDSSPGLGELQGLPGHSAGLGVGPAGGASGGA